ncbi:hypothetical protein [Kushneria indalinina]|uniref:Uncharacterized protein n=1 Tax=Kushneria indalinina DSM 14324 TaxID=1122140 RepID=A0A3D9DRK8_9GAMM|nr:hypothetical protein [Kushneria indalinina]REC93383.1 hypothetical protein C8D72_3428 [Kushneria indalinina DSM 14324]
MKVNVNQLVYDDAHPQCTCRVVQSQGQLYAMVQCLDMGMDGEEVVGTKRYWGTFEWDSEDHMRAILKNGGKWDDHGPI